MTRTVLAAVAACLVVVGGVAAALYAYNRPTELRVAVAQGAQDLRLMTAAAQTFAHQREEVRLKVVPVADAAAAAAALERGSTDLAVLRSDALPPAARAMLVLHRNAALLIAPGGTKLKRVADLRGKNIGMVQEVAGAQSNARLLETILDQYDIPRHSVTTTVVAPGAVEASLRARAIDAIFLVAPPQFGVASEVVGKVAAAGNGKAPVFLPIAEAKAIAKRVPTLETTEVLRGALGGDPPRPAESLETPSVAVLLVGSPSIAAGVAGAVTRELLVHRAALAALAPLANYMEAPSTDKDSAVPAHQGTIDFIDGNENGFFDKYSDFFYLGAMLTSLVGSAAAALASRLRISTQERSERLIERLLEILPAARVAPAAAELDDYERELDQTIVDALADVRLRKMAPAELHTVSMALDQARLAIQERRRVLSETRAEVTPLRSLREVRAGE
jgi:TRAP-type uncharacterized transport system substrate-binding protein